MVVDRRSPNVYPRGLRAYQLIVLHATQGHNDHGSAEDLRGLADFMCQRSSEVSVQVATDDDGDSVRIVSDRDAAWHVEAFNPVALGVEQVGFAEQKRWSRLEMKETARWIAQWSYEHGIPIKRGYVHGSTVVSVGVVTHKQLGAAGGGHTDPGSGYQVKRVLRWAKLYKALRYRGRGSRPKHH